MTSIRIRYKLVEKVKKNLSWRKNTTLAQKRKRLKKSHPKLYNGKVEKSGLSKYVYFFKFDGKKFPDVQIEKTAAS